MHAPLNCSAVAAPPRRATRLQDALSLSTWCTIPSQDLENVSRPVNAFSPRSLKTRVTLFTLAIFLAGLWSLALYASEMLRADLQRLLGDQQRATLALMSEEIDQELGDRLHALELLAKDISPATLTDFPAMQALLERQAIFLGLFNGGTFVTDAQGTASASTPRSASRKGVNYMERDHIAAALKHGKSIISTPVLGKMLKVPVFSMAAPIHDAQGQVIGALVGVILLEKANFLERISKYAPGKTGSYALIAPKDRLIVAASDKSRALQPLPPPGLNAGLDRILQGFEGSAVYTNAQGVEVLLSAKGLSSGGWIMAAELPTEEAFAPIREMQQRLFLATLLLTLLAGMLTWWMLRRQLSPMLATMEQLSAMSSDQQPLRPLAVMRDDEVGQLIRGFNQLLAFLGQRKVALKESEERFRTLTEWMPEAIAVHSGGKMIYVNPAAIKLFGARCADEIVGRPVLDFVHPDFRQLVVDRVQRSQDLGTDPPALEEKFLKLDGSTIDVLVTGIVITYDGQSVNQVVIRDITESLRAQEQMRKLSRIIEQAPMSIVITDLTGRIEYINPWVSAVTGYSPQEILGKNPRVLQSGLTPPQVHQSLWKTLMAGGVWRGEFHNRKASGDVYVEQAVVAPVLDADGHATHYVALKEDITERKRAERKIVRLSQLYAALSRCNEAIVRTSNEAELFAQICRDAVTFGGMKMAWIGLVDPLAQVVKPQASFGDVDGYLQDIQISTDAGDPRGLGPTANAIANNQAFWCQDFARDPRTAPWRERGAIAGWAASAALPLCRNGLAVGALTLYAGEVNAFDEDIRSLLLGMSQNISFAISGFAREQARRRAQAELGSVLQALDQHAIVATTDLQGRLVSVNNKLCEVSGYAREELLGQDHQVLNSDQRPQSYFHAMTEAIAQRKVWHGEVRNRAKDGHDYWMQTTIAPFMGEDGRPERFVVIRTDITERKKTEASLREHSEQLRALSRRVLEVQEAERRRLAVELHDELGQLLTAIKINLQSNQRFRSQAPDELNVENIRIVENALQQVRRLALALRPSMLDDLGLAPALRWMAEQNAQRAGFVAQLYTDRLHDRLAPDIEIACFRIVQEALTNIARHAHARQVQISLLEEGPMLVLIVKDDGCGFDVAAMMAGALAGGSMGVLGMQERAALIGGQLDLQSAPGDGSTLRMQCPMRLRGDAT